LQDVLATLGTAESLSNSLVPDKTVALQVTVWPLRDAEICQMPGARF
jgi:hypothetical protein